MKRKFCPKCKKRKNSNSFHKDAARKLGLQSYCKKCQYNANREYLQTEEGKKMFSLASKRYYNKKGREKHLVDTYGISIAERDILLQEQGNVCGICEKGDPGKRGWQVDHDHKTGKVRGVLCLNCNSGIGNLRDSPLLLKKAIDYLERRSAPSVGCS